MSLLFGIGVRLAFLGLVGYIVYWLANNIFFKKSNLEKAKEKVKEQKEYIENLKNLDIPDPKELKKVEIKLEKILKEIK
jgi:uncharacterized membrane protein YciS (DUF1049 family)